MGIECPKCHFNNPDDTVYCGKCATPLPSSKEIPVTETLETPTEELTTGSTFAGRYQIIEELGKGGMGKVYRVLDKELKEEVAIKLIKPDIASDKKTLERFSNELKLARKISHKNVGRMYELMEEKGTRYITMEYVPGEDLKRLIRKIGQLSAGQAIPIAKQVCEGLTEAHRLGVVHRDLKPQNVMVDEEGNARILDFGIARTVKGKGITGTGVMVGTPEYMSPEQAEVKEVDQRSDIYALGVILYEMVTGRVPFEGETPLGIAMKHKNETPKDPRELNTQIPEDLSQVILRCMEKDKDQRYQSAGEVRSELENIEKGISTTEKVIPKKKPITSKEITVTFGLKKLFIPTLVVMALVTAVVIVLQVLPRKEAIPPVSSDKPSLAVMYFKNNTGDESLDYWRTMLSDLLITDLSQSKFLRVLSGEQLFNILNQLNQLEAETYSSNTLNEVAVHGAVSYLLLGKYARMGDVYRIDVVIQEAGTGEIIGSERVEARGKEDVFPKVDELTTKIKANFNLSADQIASDVDKEVKLITSSSPEAYKHYSEGRKYHYKADYQKAIQSYKEAVESDPEFAMAYRSLCWAYDELGYPSEQRKYIKKAFELRDRASDRERYQIEGDFYSASWKTYDKAIEAYNKLLQIYPDSIPGNANLGTIYRGLEEWDKANERFEVCIQNKVGTFHPYTGQALTYMATGSYDKAIKILEEYLNNISDNARVRYYLALTYLCLGKFDLSLIELNEAMDIGPPHHGFILLKGDVYSCKADLIDAEKEYQKLLQAEEPTAQYYGKRQLGALYSLQGRFEEAKDQVKQGIELVKKFGNKSQESFLHRYLAYLHLISGNPEETLRECDRAWNSAVEEEYLPWQKYALHLKGLAYLGMNTIDKAQKTAEELKELTQKGLNKKHIRLFYNLAGNIELKREDYARAIEYFNEGISFMPSQYDTDYPQAFLIEPLALAYYKARDLEKAQGEYEKIISLTVGRLMRGDIYAKSFYMLGKIYEEKGWKGKAIENYDKFLDLWKDADPGIAEVEDAKKRLAGLKSQ